MIKIITDSSSNLIELPEQNYASVPLKIIVDGREYVDDKKINVDNLINDLKKCKTTSTSCPCTADWLDAFDKNDEIFVITITSALSGSYNSAYGAKKEYLAKHPEAKIHIIDSLSTGPEMRLMVDKIQGYIDKGYDFETIRKKIREYQKKTHLLFALQSIENLAKNGRVNAAVAKIVGMLGIRIVGEASDSGTLSLLNKCRTEKNALSTMIAEMKKNGWSGGKVYIDHCKNMIAAQALKSNIIKEYPQCKVSIDSCYGLCSYYAERGGLLVGYES